MYELRDYQHSALDALMNYFNTNGDDPNKHPVINACVGAGKSIMIAEFIRRVIKQWPDQKILMVVHSQELVQQNYDKLKVVAPDLDIGVFAAGLKRREHGHQVTFASIQSIHNKAYTHIGFKNLIMIDEAHAISKAMATGTYRKFLADMKAINPKVRYIGWTGTPFRLDGGSIIKGKSRLFTDICYSITIKELTELGFLVPLSIPKVSDQVSTTGLKKVAGDFKGKELSELMNEDKLIESAVNQIVKHGEERKSWLIFCAGIEHAENVRDKIIENDISCVTLNGKTPKAERKQILEDFKSHKIQAITNVGVLTTGFDHPTLDLIALLRPTASPGLFIQMIGRGLRTAENKKDCLFMDFTDTTQELSPIDGVIDIPNKEDTQVKSTTKVCPKCEETISILLRVCEFCGYEYPEPEKRELKHRDNFNQFSPTDPIAIFQVTNVRYSKHSKIGKTDSMRVDYYLGLRMVASEWVCIQHGGFARGCALNWWCKRTLQPFPPTVDEALELSEFLKKPDMVKLRKENGFKQVIGHHFKEAA